MLLGHPTQSLQVLRQLIDPAAALRTALEMRLFIGRQLGLVDKGVNDLIFTQMAVIGGFHVLPPAVKGQWSVNV
jgi:hypothetical protein